MGIARKALEDQGYEVVDFNILEEEFAEARRFIIGIVTTGTVPGTRKDVYKHGENLCLDVWLYYFLISLPSSARWVLHKLMKLVGVGRGVAILEDTKELSVGEYEQLIFDRYKFSILFSYKWQETGISALIMPTFPHCSFHSKDAIEMGMML